MNLLQPLFDLLNAIVGFLNGVLDVIERLFGPVIELIERWNGLFG